MFLQGGIFTCTSLTHALSVCRSVARSDEMDYRHGYCCCSLSLAHAAAAAAAAAAGGAAVAAVVAAVADARRRAARHQPVEALGVHLDERHDAQAVGVLVGRAEDLLR